MELRPIGKVISRTEGRSEVEIYPRFSAGLKRIERNTHIWILFWMSKLSESDREVLEAHPMGDRTREKRGVFALRSPMRPNPIGLTKVELIERRNNVLIVSGLDAFEDTPVVDIKPA
jgi:tRNA-Thr(GGU) m(6)t(6)A37 methyltransferase TsaA